MIKKYRLGLLIYSTALLLSACATSNSGEETESSETVIETSSQVESSSELQSSAAEVVTAATEGGYVETELEWSIQPELGIKKGDYYRIEERFRQGHLGTLEVVKQDGQIIQVEFNEQTRPNYYHRYFQDVPKRMSEYNFDMGEKKGAAWVQSVLLVEKQMKDEQRLTGDFEVVTGASNSINQSMLVLAEKLVPMLEEPTSQHYYSIAEELEGGLTGYLKVVMEGETITSVRYDEIFADSYEDITEPNLQQFYRQSKYESVEYEEPSRIGFNVQMDALNEKVVETQDLLDLSGLPATDESGDYAGSGFTIRNDAWDNYLRLAEQLQTEIETDLAE